ncbi:hypothetical protein [Aquimarina longa]|uniref:hypothetical protein n=1 Tax=Aquimarina longa TaxID=1080221 RepID=UPI000AAF242A|nr:hypothetical protein [Aquimarina longa]
MKRFCFSLLAIVSILVLVGCQFSETLNLNEDGTGKITMSFDGSELMKMGGEKVSEEGKKDIDTTVVFREFLEKNKDSISKLSTQMQEKLERLRDFKMHVVVNKNSSKADMDLYKEFKDVSELGNLFSDFKTSMVMGGNVSNKTEEKSNTINPIDKALTSEDDGVKVHYSFRNNTFNRFAEIVDEEKMKKSIDSIEKARMFLASSKYKLKYTFPRKIIKMSSDKATFSLDMKSFILEVGLIEYMQNPKILDIELELEE